MASPFPGMDPYLEAHWRDVHARLVIYASDALQPLLPRALRARVEEQVLLETPQGIGDHPLYPDVRIIDYGHRPGPPPGAAQAVALAESVLVDLAPEAATETYLEIIDRESGNRVVTVLEFLSPSNKSPGRNREQHERKQRQLCESDCNYVEIDLNRFGTHGLFAPVGQVPARLRTPYLAAVRRTTQPFQARVYPMPLVQRLPVLPIPLRPTDPDVPLDLQVLVDQCYRNGGYEATVDYTTNPDPPLRGQAKDWAEKLLVEKGLRPAKKSPRGRGKNGSR